MNRTPAKAQQLARQAKAKCLNRSKVKAHQFDVIVNATPLGMESAETPLNEKEIRARFVLDLVYSRGETPFTKAARTAGAEVIPGVEVFVHQGARQFEIWSSKPAPAPEMLNVVNAALAAQTHTNQGGRNGRK
jgi:3-dehydroquinate dehydratase/shikimate dehydrogenase